MRSLINTAKQELLFLERVFVHAGFREVYSFAKNSWGMLVHPQLTTARIWGNKNYTQMFLVFGFPFNIWLVAVFIGGGFWLVFQPGPGWQFWLGRVFLALTALLAGVGAYYASWLWRYRRRLKLARKGRE